MEEIALKQFNGIYENLKEEINASF